MNIKNLTGYMLGTSDYVIFPGEQWADAQTQVWVCRDLNIARDILRNSHKNMGCVLPIWTTIYRVRGTNVPCDRIDSQFFYTSRPDKIIVDSAVYYQEPRPVSEGQLLSNARQIRNYYMRLTNTKGGK